MKTGNRLFIITACLITLTLLTNSADALTLSFKAKRCGTATVDPTNLSNVPAETVNSFIEKGTLVSAMPTPLPAPWDNIPYTCYGYILKITSMQYTAKEASGYCRFNDSKGDTISADMLSTNDTVEFRFSRGTGAWRRATGIATGSGEMPFMGGGTAQQCSSPMNFKIKKP